MTATALIVFALWILTLAAVVCVVFIVKTLTRIERLADHVDATLSEIDRKLPVLVEGTHRTIQSFEAAATQAQKLMTQIERPIKSISLAPTLGKIALSPQTVAALVGFVRGLSFFIKLFRRRRGQSPKKP